jgi:hypothetical protein
LELIVIYEMEDDVTLSDLAHKFIPVLVSFAALRRPKSLSESMGSFMPVRPVFYNGALHPKVKRSSVKIGYADAVVTAFWYDRAASPWPAAAESATPAAKYSSWAQTRSSAGDRAVF